MPSSDSIPNSPSGRPRARLVRQCKARPPAAMFPPIPPAAPPSLQGKPVPDRPSTAVPAPVPFHPAHTPVPCRMQPKLERFRDLASPAEALCFVRRHLSGRGQSRGGYGAPRQRHPCDRHGDRMRSRHACRWRRLVPFDQRCAPQRVRVPDRGRRRPAVHPFPGFPA
jgi:hypothetical protein